jgi:EAL domain-containing protein (putative c-di-GMP-specific phosphodiesterase class I)
MGKRLLILDDEADFVGLIVGVAQELGWTVETTASAAEFLAALARLPDAIALGLPLDSSDGIALLRILKQAARDAPILLTSGFDDRVLLGARHFGLSLGLPIAGALKKPARAGAVRDALWNLERPRGARIAVVPAPIRPAAIAQAIAGGQMVLFLQPIIAADSFDVEKFEALIRWQHPERGLLLPANFIPIAEEEVGVIDQLTDWVFEAAIDVHLALRAHDLERAISVNVSSRNLHAGDFPDRLEALMRGKGVDRGTFHVEISEGALTGGLGEMSATLSQFRRKGFALVLDDFGSGSPALDLLEVLPLSELKIDKPLIGELMVDSDTHATVSSAIRRARSLSLRTVAEGVETAEATAELRALGISGLQGHYFGPPQPITHIPETVAALRWGRDVMDRATRGRYAQRRVSS